MAAPKEVMPWEPLRSGRRGRVGTALRQAAPGEELGRCCLLLEHPC